MAVSAMLEIREAFGPVSYRIDEEGLLTGVGGDWTSFARENGGDGGLVTGIGASIWDAINGDEIVDVYRRLLARVRRSGPVAFRYRCDAPGLRRELALEIRPVDGGFEFVSTVLRERPAKVTLVDRLRAPGLRLPRRLHVCAWCNCVEHGQAWLGFDGPAAQIAEAPLADPPEVVNGICPACRERVLARSAPQE